MVFRQCPPSRCRKFEQADSSMSEMPRAFLERLFGAAVAAAHPAGGLPAQLPPPPGKGRILLLAAGKAAGSMAEVAERHYRDVHGLGVDRLGGLAVARHGYGRPTQFV